MTPNKLNILTLTIIFSLLSSCAKHSNSENGGQVNAAEVAAVPLKSASLVAQALVGTVVGIIAIPFGEKAMRNSMDTVMQPIGSGTDNALNLLLEAGGSNVRLVGRKGFERLDADANSVRVPVDATVRRSIEMQTGRKVFRTYAIYNSDTGETTYLDESAA